MLATMSHAETVGHIPLSFEAPHHGSAVTGAVWYPAAEAGPTSTFAENPVFEGVQVAHDAPVAAGSHPVVALSHGMGGELRSLAWLATALAERGAIVVAVNHPNSTWSNFDLAKSLRHWTRAQDLSLALDAVWADDRFAGRLDPARVMAAGFSFGGWTALTMGGLRGNHDGYVAHCAAYGAASSHCDDLMAAEIGLMDVAASDWDASYGDARINRVVAIDPGLIWGVTAADATDLIENVRLIGLGDAQTRLLATDFDASGLVDVLPDAQVDRLVPAVHFTAMPLCKPAGAAILAEEEDDPVCTDPEGADRAAVHAAIIEAMARDLGL